MSSDIIYLNIISKSVTDLDFLYEKPWGKNPKSIERLNQKKHKISKLSMLKKYFFFFRGEGKVHKCLYVKVDKSTKFTQI